MSGRFCKKIINVLVMMTHCKHNNSWKASGTSQKCISEEKGYRASDNPDADSFGALQLDRKHDEGGLHWRHVGISEMWVRWACEWRLYKHQLGHTQRCYCMVKATGMATYWYGYLPNWIEVEERDVYPVRLEDRLRSWGGSGYLPFTHLATAELHRVCTQPGMIVLRYAQ